MTPYGLYIRKLRADNQLNLMDMSIQTGIKVSDLSGVEVGRNPVTDEIIYAAKYYFSLHKVEFDYESAKEKARISNLQKGEEQ